MEKRTLFEIPIYAMSEKEFNKHWKKKELSMIICLSIAVILKIMHCCMFLIAVSLNVYGNTIR